MRKIGVLRRADGLAVLTVGLALALSACGSGDHPAKDSSSGGTKTHKAHKSGPAGQPGEPDMSDMVAAVSASKAGPPLEMKFSLSGRPEVGQALDVNVVVIPRNPVPDSVSVSFQVIEGLEIIEGAQLERVEKLTDGAPIHHVVKVLPKRDGIFALTAVASYAAANQDLSRTFSIPVIAGEGIPAQVAKGP